MNAIMLARVRGRLGAAVIVAVVLGGAAASPAAAGSDETSTLTVTGELLTMVVDSRPQLREPDSGSSLRGRADEAATTVTESFVEVDGTLLGVPHSDADALDNGEVVSVTLSAPAGMPADEAVELAGMPESAAGAASVSVVGVSPASSDSAGAASAPAAGAASAPAGAHTITVLPVFWSATDGTTTAELGTLARDAAAFWSEQSSGTIATTTTVLPWTRIADPGSCDVETIYNLASSASGYAGPGSEKQHVVVYFPPREDCGGWVGWGTYNAPFVFVNGYPHASVFAHELGHNLGLGHANARVCTSGGVYVPMSSTCSVYEYEDVSDVMGYSMSEGYGNLNTALASTLGLVRSVAAEPTKVVTVDLPALGQVGQVRALRIPLLNGNDLWVDYRAATGRDTYNAGDAGVQVHALIPGEAVPSSELILMRPNQTAASVVAMAAGSSYVIPGSSYTLSVLSTSGTSARVSVVPTAGTSPFTDVPRGYPFFTEISWLYDMHVTNGMGDGTFGTTAPVSREAMAAFLYRYSGDAYTPPTTAHFSDVPTTHPFYREISWLYSKGITTGFADGTYGDKLSVSREAMAAFLYRFAAATGTAPTTAHFTDVPTTHPFYREISWLYGRGITNGYADGTYGGLLPVSREAMAAFLYRYAHPPK